MTEDILELPSTFIAAEFALAEVEITFSDVHDATALALKVASLSCVEGRQEMFDPDQWEESAFEYQFTFAAGEPPDQMTSSQHYTVIKGSLPTGQRLVIRGVAWAFIDEVGAVIDGSFSTPPVIETLRTALKPERPALRAV